MLSDEEIKKMADEMWLENFGKIATERRINLWKVLNVPMVNHSLDLWIIYFYWCDGLMWARWFSYGSGFKIKNTKKHPLLFSERNGLKGKQIGKWFFCKLKSMKNGDREY